MTFEEFQATKRPCDNLPEAVHSAPWTDEPAKGFLYLGGLYIEEVTDAWPEAARRAGKYHLLIHRSEWITDDIAELERHLYEFAVSEGIETQ